MVRSNAYVAWSPSIVVAGLLAVLIKWQLREPSSETSATDIDLPPLSEELKDALSATAQALATRGKGILAADESTPTVRVFHGLVWNWHDA